MAIMNMVSYRDEASNNQNSFVACENSYSGNIDSFQKNPYFWIDILL
jgi:hypothetical protein